MQPRIEDTEFGSITIAGRRIEHWNKARGAAIGLFHVTC